jgi:hypothetical protein
MRLSWDLTRGLPNNELQLTSGTCRGRVEPLRGTTRWLS